jgi:hypothetical protein
MSRWRNIFTKRSNDLDEEIRLHIAVAIRDRVERGESPETARIAVMREFGNVLLVKDVVSETWGWGYFDRFIQDLRFAVRQLRKSPGFAVTVVLIVALAVGANTTIFSLAYALLLRSLPVAHPDQLVQLQLDPGSRFYRLGHRYFTPCLHHHSSRGTSLLCARGCSGTHALPASR